MMLLNQGFKLCNILMENECLLEGVFDTIIHILIPFTVFFLFKFSFDHILITGSDQSSLCVTFDPSLHIWPILYR